MSKDLQMEIENISLVPPNFPLDRLEKIGDFIVADQSMGFVSTVFSMVKLALGLGYVLAWNILAKNTIEDRKRKLEILIRLRNQNSNEVID